MKITVNKTGSDNGSIITAPGDFSPVPWLRNGHAQTLWRKFATVPPVDHRRQRIELSDGDFIDVDWYGPAPQSPACNGTAVLLLHGLCGCSRSGYIQSLQHRLGQSGYLSLAMNFRGCSGEINRLARAYHSGVTSDLSEVFSAVRKELPDHRFAAVGFSLGANVLLKWLGESGQCNTVENVVESAVAVSTPFNLALCSRAMLGGMSRLYGRFFLRRLVADVEAKKQHFERHGSLEQLELLRACGDLGKLTSLWDFDDRVTAPLHGFEGAADYYEQCSSIRFLEGIQVPTLLLQSLDDPIIPSAALPGERHFSEKLVTDFSDRGDMWASPPQPIDSGWRIGSSISSAPGKTRVEPPEPFR